MGKYNLFCMQRRVFVLVCICIVLLHHCGLPKSLVKTFCNCTESLFWALQNNCGEGKKTALCFTLLIAMSKKVGPFFERYGYSRGVEKCIFCVVQYYAFIFLRVKYWYESAPFRQELNPIWHEKWSLFMRSHFSIHHGSDPLLAAIR